MREREREQALRSNNVDKGMQVALTHYMSKLEYASNYNQTITSTHKSKLKY